MKVADVDARAIVVVGRRGALPPLIEPTANGDEVLVLALGPRVTAEQQRAVEEAIGIAVERRIPFEARIVSPAEAAAIIADATDASTVRMHALSRRDLRSLGTRRR